MVDVQRKQETERRNLIVPRAQAEPKLGSGRPGNPSKVRMQIEGLEFGINSMKPWTQSALCQQARLLVAYGTYVEICGSGWETH